MKRVDMSLLKNSHGIYNFYGYRDFYEQFNDKFDLFVLDKYQPSIYPAHFHTSNEIYYVQSGEILINANQKEKVLTAGDLLFINSLDIHSFEVIKNGFVFCFQFGEMYLKDYKNLYKDSTFPNFLTDKEKNKPIIELIMSLDNENQATINELDKIAYVNRILSAVIKQYGLNHISQDETLIIKIVKYIYQHYNEYDLGLKRISEEFNYSEVSISRFFNKYMGSNIKQYINLIRMINFNRMKEDKDYSHLSVTQIASLCGFNSPTTFYRCKSALEQNKD